MRYKQRKQICMSQTDKAYLGMHYTQSKQICMLQRDKAQVCVIGSVNKYVCVREIPMCAGIGSLTFVVLITIRYQHVSTCAQKFLVNFCLKDPSVQVGTISLFLFKCHSFTFFDKASTEKILHSLFSQKKYILKYYTNEQDTFTEEKW